ncbi:MAG: hypothetical protein JNK82_02995 [Myxococcaceae bacterium]|nr:hypothetical protein [Myxococcaceae bacterium]
MSALRRAVVCLLINAAGCGPAEDVEPLGPRAEVSREALATANDLYAQLRQLENLLPPVPASQTLAMGSWVPGGNFVGVGKTCRIVYPQKVMVCTPATATVNAINAVLRFEVPQGVQLTANGRTATAGFAGFVQLDVGDADTVSWTLRSGASSYSDTLLIARPAVNGMGAFTIAALPLTILYEPPQNAAQTNSASTSFANEQTVVNTLSSGSSTSRQPKWAEGEVAKQLGVKLAGKFPPTAAAYGVLQGIVAAWGSVTTTVTNDSEVTSEELLLVKVSESQAITTSAHLGPGRGDTIVYYRDARVAWGMDAGRVSLTLIDHGPLQMFSAETLKADLAALNAGATATASGLDADTLRELLVLDPLSGFSNSPHLPPLFGGVSLPASRFTKKSTVTINAAMYTLAMSHNVTTTDTLSQTITSTTVKDFHPGWLTLIGVGQNQAGKVTTRVTLGASRSVTLSQTKSATLSLAAAAAETYSVDVFYDNIMGTFLTRKPPPPPPVIVIGPGSK